MSFLRLISQSRAWAGTALLLAGALLPNAAAQDRVILRNGEKVEGRVVGEEGGNLRIAVGFGEIRIRRSFVVRIESSGPTPGASPVWKLDSLTTQPADGKGEAFPRTPARRPRPTAAPAAEGPAEGMEGAASRPVPRASIPPPLPEIGGSFDERVEGVLARFLWFLPAGGFRIGFGALLVVGTTLLILFASRMADIENRTLGRSLLFSVCLLTILSLAVHFATFSPLGLTLLVVVAAVAWFGLARGVLGAGAYRGTVLLTCFTFSLLLIVMWIEVLGLAFRPSTA